jgi:molecular chaperone GrpE
MVDRNEESDEVEALDLDGGDDDVERVMREAEAAVDEVESHHGKGAARRRLEERDEELERLRREVQELRDKSLRTLAEFENFRKRTDREQQDLRRYAVTEPMRAFLDVVDNLERALAASGSLEDLKTGVEMILRQMQDLLRQHGVREVPAAGEAFDPNLHEAVAREESEEVSEPRVAEEFQKGYVIHDRLLRPSRVKVAVPASGGGPDA